MTWAILIEGRTLCVLFQLDQALTKHKNRLACQFRPALRAFRIGLSLYLIFYVLEKSREDHVQSVLSGQSCSAAPSRIQSRAQR